MSTPSPTSQLPPVCNARTPEWLTLGEVAALLRVDEETVRALCVRHESGKPGGLRSVNVSPADDRKLRRVHRDDLEAFARPSCVRPPDKPPPKPAGKPKSKYSWV